MQIAGNWGAFDTITGFGDYNRDGRGDLLVRRPGKPAYLLPSNGDGTFGHWLGPIARPRGAAWVGGVDLLGNDAPDADRATWRPSADLPQRGHLRDRCSHRHRPTHPGFADLLLNAGDWDRDGYGDLIARNRKYGNLLPAAR